MGGGPISKKNSYITLERPPIVPVPLITISMVLFRATTVPVLLVPQRYHRIPVQFSYGHPGVTATDLSVTEGVH